VCFLAGVAKAVVTLVSCTDRNGLGIHPSCEGGWKPVSEDLAQPDTELQGHCAVAYTCSLDPPTLTPFIFTRDNSEVWAQWELKIHCDHL